MRLSTLYPTLSTEQRVELAKAADISDGYLYQLATRWRGKTPTIHVMTRLADADVRLTLTDMLAEFSEAPADAEQKAGA